MLDASGQHDSSPAADACAKGPKQVRVRGAVCGRGQHRLPGAIGAEFRPAGSGHRRLVGAGRQHLQLATCMADDGIASWN